MKKRAIQLLAAVTALSFGLAACAKPAEQPKDNGQTTEAALELNEVGTYPITKQPLKMTMMRLSRPNITDFATNDFTKFIQEKTNIEWEFQTVNVDSYKEQISLTMTKSPLPDVFLFVTPSVAKYGVAEQLIQPITEEQIKANMPNFTKFLESRPELLNQMKQADGKIYGLPAINDCFHCFYRNKMWINEKHLKELGMEAPKTTEDLKTLLKAWVDKKQGNIGMSGSADGWGQQFYNWITNAFVFDPGENTGKLVFNKETGKVESTAVTDGFREALKYMNELFQAGLIDEGALTQKEEEYKKVMNLDGDPVLMSPNGTISNAYDANEKGESYAAYRVIEPLTGPTGEKQATFFRYDGVAENKFVITKDCKYVEPALRWIDYFYTLEGYLSMQFGAEKDKDWTMNVDGAVGLDGKPALYKVLNAYSMEPQNHDWQDAGLNFATATTRLGQATEANIDIASADGLEKLLFIESKEKMEPFGQKGKYDVLPALKYTADESAELSQISVDVTKYIDEARAAFIRGTMDPNDDAAWQSYLDGFKGVNLDKLIEFAQAAYDRAFKK